MILLFGYVVFIWFNLLLVFIQPDCSPFRDTISGYANGEFGILLNVALVSFRVANIYLAKIMNEKSRFEKINKILFFSSGIFIIISGIFNTDKYGEDTVSGIVHSLFSGLAFLVFILSNCLYSLIRKHILFKISSFGLVCNLIGLYLADSGQVGLWERIFVFYIIINNVFILIDSTQR